MPTETELPEPETARTRPESEQLRRWETSIDWLWTEAGFAAMLPQLKPEPTFPVFFAILICACVAIPLLAMSVVRGHLGMLEMGVAYWIAYGLMTFAALVVWCWTDPLGLFDQRASVPLAGDATVPPVFVEVRGDTLRLGERTVALTEIDDILFSSGRLRVRYGNHHVWASKEVRWASHEGVRELLVPWLEQAIDKARERQAAREEQTRAARRATANLRRQAAVIARPPPRTWLDSR